MKNRLKLKIFIVVAIMVVTLIIVALTTPDKPGPGFGNSDVDKPPDNPTAPRIDAPRSVERPEDREVQELLEFYTSPSILAKIQKFPRRGCGAENQASGPISGLKNLMEKLKQAPVSFHAEDLCIMLSYALVQYSLGVNNNERYKDALEPFKQYASSIQVNASNPSCPYPIQIGAKTLNPREKKTFSLKIPGLCAHQGAGEISVTLGIASSPAAQLTICTKNAASYRLEPCHVEWKPTGKTSFVLIASN